MRAYTLPAPAHTIPGDEKMKTSKELLTSVLKTTQMGQTGIRSVLKTTVSQPMRTALQSQLHEYDMLEQETQALAASHGWQLPELNPVTRGMADMMTRARLRCANPQSQIAGMMIQGNTRGMITGLKNLHQYNHRDNQIQALSQKLLDYETANIQAMQKFL